MIISKCGVGFHLAGNIACACRDLDKLGFEVVITRHAGGVQHIFTVTHPLALLERRFNEADFLLFTAGVLAGANC